jgi:hypothetical protein
VGHAYIQHETFSPETSESVNPNFKNQESHFNYGWKVNTEERGLKGLHRDSPVTHGQSTGPRASATQATFFVHLLQLHEFPSSKKQPIFNFMLSGCQTFNLLWVLLRMRPRCFNLFPLQKLMTYYRRLWLWFASRKPKKPRGINWKPFKGEQASSPPTLGMHFLSIWVVLYKTVLCMRQEAPIPR